jgi:hypothetical protein
VIYLLAQDGGLATIRRGRQPVQVVGMAQAADELRTVLSGTPAPGRYAYVDGTLTTAPDRQGLHRKHDLDQIKAEPAAVTR